jgi:nickel-dependent lactate racemase
MEVRLAYGENGLDLIVPDRIEVDRFGLSAAEKPLGYADFESRFAAAGARKLFAGGLPLVIVNDGHRSTPTTRVLKWLDQYDSRLLDRLPFLIACGTHEEPSPDHLATIFGPYLDRVRDRLFWHDCRDLESMTKVGTDRFGEDVLLNRRAAEAVKLLAITSVEPHYFAGFTGGRKSFFPGLTDRATIERNHNLANSLDCAPLRIAGNPMAEHLDEMLDLLRPDRIFSVQLIVDAGRRIGDVFCGPIREAFAEAIVASEKLYAVPVEQPYDLVIAEVRSPLDRSLYQIQKALENCQLGVRDGGAIVVVAACRDGIGKRAFYDLADRWDREANAPVDGIPRFGSHKLSRVVAMSRRIKVCLHSELSENQPRRVFYEPVADLQQFLDENIGSRDRKRLAIVHDAGHTVLKPIDAQ